ncbi:MAG TPA: thioether cross-link-forming SCIFF peptide maturase [Peptococcaceae bacterium]|nr:MAG: Radical SAM domain protein [Clostridia bacterium 41_269]HBT19882.1 thioether cross-link-forming SCIFF peptide maturase [Peptococcaceae bacterium]
MAEVSDFEAIYQGVNKNVHKFKINGLPVLLDAAAGSVHLIDNAVWDFLDSIENCCGRFAYALRELERKYSRREIKEVLRELISLRDLGLLFADEPNAEEFLEKEKEREFMVKALCLHAAHDCNMTCGYCFAAEGNFGLKKELMSKEVGERAVDFLLENSGSRRTLEIDFFGGEPLLNFEAIEHITAYGNKKAEEYGKRINFTLTTNCLLLNQEVCEFVNRNKMQVILSLDGRKIINDRVRLLKDGRGSYDVVVKRILNFVESRNHENYYVRGTFTRKNLDFSKDVFHLFDLGLKHVSVEPVVAPPGEYGFYEDDISVLEMEYERLAEGLVKRMLSGQDIDFYHFNIDLDEGQCLSRKIRGCGAGFEYFAVTPSGDIYPCHQFVGEKNFLMGNVFEGIKNKDMMELFRSAHIYSKPKCRECWAKFICSGGCHASAYYFNGSLFEPLETACILQKKRIECGIYFQLYKRFGQQISELMDFRDSLEEKGS